MKEDYTHQITDIGWEGGTLSELRPYIKIRRIGSGMKKEEDSGEENKEIKLYTPYLLNWKLSDEKYCPGDLRGPCPFDNKIDYKYERCPYCEKKVGFKAAFLFGEEPNERMKEHLSQDHYIYLAYFAPDIIKVGTAAANRKYIRLIEQDALQALFIARSSGFSIQNLEHAISKEIGITEMVKSKQKYQYIKYRQDGEKAREAILSIYQKIVDRFRGTEFESWLLEIALDTDFIDMSSLKTLIVPELDSEVVRIRQPKLIVGKFIGLRGKYVLCKYEDIIISLKITSLVGRKLLCPTESLKYEIQR